MNMISVVIIGFIVLEATNVIALYFFPGSKYANSVGAEKVIIIGEKELAKESATVRDMRSGEQLLVPISDIVQYISG